MIWYVASIPMWCAAVLCLWSAAVSLKVIVREQSKPHPDATVAIGGFLVIPVLLAASSGCAWLAAKIMGAA